MTLLICVERVCQRQTEHHTELNLPSPGAGLCNFAEAQAPVNTTMFVISFFLYPTVPDNNGVKEGVPGGVDDLAEKLPHNSSL
jgi:hypothetical protein